MRSCGFFNGLVMLIIGGLIGAGIMYHVGTCKTSTVNLKLDNASAGPGITITKTGNEQ